jgi:hypothetical protein
MIPGIQEIGKETPIIHAVLTVWGERKRMDRKCLGFGGGNGGK